jgi:hypothetical protein
MPTPVPSTTPTGVIPHATDEFQTPLYTDGASALDQYEFQPGIAILPLAEDPPTDPEELKKWSPVVPMRLHAPYRVRHAASRAVKQNTPPIAPAPADTGKFVFVGGSLYVHNAANQTNLNYDWTVSTEYTFVENCVSRIEDGFVLGSAPWTWKSTVNNNPVFNNGVPQFGAVSTAGRDAILGYFQALAALPNLNNGKWSYNCPSFYPGVFMSADMDNGGTLTIDSVFIPSNP